MPAFVRSNTLDAPRGFELLFFFRQYHFTEFADGAVATAMREADDAVDRLYLRHGVLRASGRTDGAEEVEVVDVIADKTDIFKRDIQFVTNFLRRLQLGFGTLIYLAADAHVKVLHLQFFGSARYDRSILTGEDTARDARFLQAHNTHAVIDTETLHLIAVCRIVHAAVSETAVHICQKQFNGSHNRGQS